MKSMVEMRYGKRKFVVEKRGRPINLGSLVVTPREDSSTVTLKLPMPPSVNSLFVNTSADSRKPRATSENYDRWVRDAGWILVEQRPGRICGPYALHISFRKPSRYQPDLGNLEKAVSDLLQTHGVIVNDRLAQQITLQWVSEGEGAIVRVSRAIEVIA